MYKLYSQLLHVFALSILLLISCGKKSDQSHEEGSQAAILQLNWIADPTFTGEYLALRNGYWEDQGLKVSISPGGIGIDPITMIISGKAQFAVLGADKAAIARGSGTKIKVVAVDFQRNPVGWIARKSLNINKFSDIAFNKEAVLGDKVGTETTAILNLCLQRLGISELVTAKGVGFDFSFFIQTPNIVYPVYLNEEPVRATLHGLDIVEIDPSLEENGNIQLYGNVIIVTEDYYHQNVSAVEIFLQGLRRGWEFARDNKEESIQLLSEMMRYDEEALPEVFRRSVQFATTLNNSPVNPGSMNRERWQLTIETLLEAGLLNNPIRLEDLAIF